MIARLKIRPESPLFILMLALLSSLPPLATDMTLAALSVMGHALQTTPAMAALTLSVFQIGFAGSQVFVGPVSDGIGRRPLLLLGCLLFLVGGAICTFSQTLGLMLVGRVIAGAGAGANRLLVLAMVRDHFEGDAGRVRLSYLGLLTSLAPLIAPSIGALLLALSGWRSIYGFLTLGGLTLFVMVLVLVKESLRYPPRGVPSLTVIAAAYGVILKHRSSMACALVSGLCFGGVFIFVASSSIVMIDIFGVSSTLFGLLFIGPVASIMLGAFISGQLARRHVPVRLPLMVGMAGQNLWGLVILAVCLSHAASVANLLSLTMLYCLSFGLISTNASYGAITPHPTHAGTASALVGILAMLMGAVASAVVAWFGDYSPVHVLGCFMAIFPLLALAVYTRFIGWAGPVLV